MATFQHQNLLQKALLTLLMALMLAPFSLLQAQDVIQIRGVLQRNFGEHSAGDTVRLFTKRKNPSNPQVYQYGLTSNNSRRYISEEHVLLLDTDLDFWEARWFEERGQAIQKAGWEQDKRQELFEDAMDYYKTAKNNGLIFENEFLSDYMYQLLYFIHPTPILKEQERNLSLLLLKSPEAATFAFDNGLIVITTGLLAGLNTEKELATVLAENISHVVLEHNLVNFNRALRRERNARIWGAVAAAAVTTAMAVDEVKTGRWQDYGAAIDFGNAIYFVASDTRQNIGASYDNEQQLVARRFALRFLREYPEVLTLDDTEFLYQIAPAVSQHAVELYALKNYDQSARLLQRLEQNGLATDQDYLLMSKILRRQAHDRESNQLAMDYLMLAKQKTMRPWPEIYKEEGLLQLRLGQKEKARSAFETYREFLIAADQEQPSEFFQTEMRNVEQFLQRSGNRIRLGDAPTAAPDAPILPEKAEDAARPQQSEQKSEEAQQNSAGSAEEA
ncbi:MAG: M48 family metalloprotease [Nitritalea sp.]